MTNEKTTEHTSELTKAVSEALNQVFRKVGFSKDLWESYTVKCIYANAAINAVRKFDKKNPPKDSIEGGAHDGWIEWSGDSEGLPGIDPMSKIEAKCRNGKIYEYTARSLRVRHNGGEYDIIAYRLLEPVEDKGALTPYGRAVAENGALRQELSDAREENEKLNRVLETLRKSEAYLTEEMANLRKQFRHKSIYRGSIGDVNLDDIEPGAIIELKAGQMVLPKISQAYDEICMMDKLWNILGNLDTKKRSRMLDWVEQRIIDLEGAKKNG